MSTSIVEHDLTSMITPLIDNSQASADHYDYAHENTNSRRRTKIVAHKFERKFLGMKVREFRTNLKDDAVEEENLHGREISNFGREIHILKSIVLPKTSIARVLLTL